MTACQLHRLVGSGESGAVRWGILGRGLRPAVPGVLRRGCGRIRSHRVDDEMCEGSNVDKGSAGGRLVRAVLAGRADVPGAAGGAGGVTGGNPFNLRV
jgi:hypothetical protein